MTRIGQRTTRLTRLAGAAATILACAAPRGERADSAAAPPADAADSAAPAAPAAPAADSAGPVALRTDAARYAPGARVGLTLVNGADAQYAFNPCTRLLERAAEGGGGWRDVDEGERICTMEAWLLEPRGTRAATTELPATLAAGRYRVVIPLTREGAPPGGAHVRAASAPFEVAP